MTECSIEEQATDSFVFISVNGAGSVRSSIDGWSEISCPGSAKSTNSHTRRSSAETFNVFSGTYLHNASAAAHGSVTGTSDKGFCLISGTSDNGAVFSSNSTTFTNDERKNTARNVRTNAQCSVGSVGSRVPFSWAEITKIQPRFHHEADDDAKSYKPKVFDAPTKIATRHSHSVAVAAPAAHRKSPSPSPSTSNLSGSPNPTAANKRHKARDRDRDRTAAVRDAEEEIPMPSISETDPYATKGDVGRRNMRKSGKRGSRLKYPNGKRGGKANKNVRRKKNQK